MKIKRTAWLISLIFVFVLPFMRVDAESARERIRNAASMYPQRGESYLRALGKCDSELIVKEVWKVLVRESGYVGELLIATEDIQIAAIDVLSTAKDREVINEICRYAEKGTNEMIRFCFLKALSHLDSPEVYPSLIRIVNTYPSAYLRYIAIGALSKYVDRKEVQCALFKLAVESKLEFEQLKAVLAMANISEGERVEMLRKLSVHKGGMGSVRALALYLLCQIPGIAIEADLRNAFNSGNPLISTAACKIVAEQGLTGFREEILQALQSPYWNVAVSAISACKRLKLVVSVPVLIELWAERNGVVADEAHKALMHITGNSFGFDVRYWQRWLKNEELPTNASDHYSNHICYHGIPIRSENVLFILDNSRSMELKSGEPGKPTCKNVQSPLDIAKKELAEVISELHESVYVRLFSFADSIKWMRKEPAKLSKENKKLAHKWLESLAIASDSSTDIFGAFAEALCVNARENEFRYCGALSDTVVFVSDGLPPSGTFMEYVFIKEVIAELNRFRLVRLNTICTRIVTSGFHEAEEFMEDIAKGNNGTYKVIEVEIDWMKK